jgi:hypothetical protein
MLVSTSGEVLDTSEDFTREEWDNMQADYESAGYMLQSLSAGKDAT